jgi:large subunit ribosomal protein L25
METVNLNATVREEIGRKSKQIRANGKIPGVLYGRGVENINLAFDGKEFIKVFKEAGSSTLVNLKIEGGETVKTLIFEPQHDPLTGKIIHADLYKVNMKEEIHTEIPLSFIGESPAVRDLEGNLIVSKDEVEVKCLPDKLVSEIEVDISVLKTFDDNIKISDLNIPEGIELLADPEEMVVQVSAPRSEEEMEEMEAPAADAEKAAIENMEAATEAEKAEDETKKEDEK